MNRHDNLDRLIDGALRDYSTAEPRPGLEQRVIASLRTAPEPSRFAWLRWAAVAVACALVAIAGWQLRRPSIPQPAAGVSSLPPQIKLPPRHATAPSATSPAPAPHSLARAPKPVGPPSTRNQSPLAGPLSPGERALVALVQVAPGVAAQVSAQERAPDRPMVVPELEVSPVAVAALEVAPLEK